MAYNPQNPNGQNTMANSSPVVISSNQTAIPVAMSNTLALTDTQLRATPVPFTGVVTGNSLVSTANSTAVSLGINGVFTGTSEDVTEFSTIMITVFSDQASAIDGLSVQQSTNGTNWDLNDVLSVPINSGKTFSFGVQARFFRVVYTNGTTASTILRLQTLYSKNAKKNSSVRPQDARGNDNDFEEVLSFLMGYNSVANAWNRIGITNAVTGGNENLIDRIKVNAALRMIDNAQPSGSKLVNLTGSQLLGLDVNLRNASTLVATITAANGVAATLTIPAITAQFHYITSLKLVLYSTAARTGSATPIIVTTTNTGGLAFTFDTAGAIGTNIIQEAIISIPLKSTTLNTATTIVCPIVTGGIWRITATYFTGA